MPASYANIQRRLKAFDFKGLFTQELMWNNYAARDLSILVDGTTYVLTPVAEQRGMAVYEGAPPAGISLPNYETRRKIDTQVAKSAREHIVIFYDSERTTQIWQWVKREAGKPSACREQIFYSNQTGDALIQKIEGIAFSLEEVDGLSIVEVAGRVGAVFDVEKVTKKFYELFEKEHDTFQKFVRGIPDEELQAWYVSVMLNRLMFIYFIQKKGFLNRDPNYLQTKLKESKRRGKDKFYGEVLCPLFFEGFAKQERSRETAQLLGDVPFLNGGLFLKHQIEELYGSAIEIPDSAFEKIFRFFEAYDWHLDDRPARKGNEVNPDVLGYVFEKYINQKEMGAYYTKEDITEYIAKNTILPVIFDNARNACKAAFEGEQSVWSLLQTDPDRYIHSAVLHGIEKQIPSEIAAGISDVGQRGSWNTPAPPEYALPVETWREVVGRRTRCEQIRKKLATGEIQSVDDLITCNLDIRRFAEEVIANCERPELLRAFRNAIWNLSVLDPTCGSGAFLFAALTILESLYDTCMVRMQAFVDDLQRSDSKYRPEKFSDFRKILDEMNDKVRHPSPRYFILKSVILNNLYGVDIMEEATEICKLRIFLKLVAQVNAGERIEPLPDIDFNIRAGNSLVGFIDDDDLHRVFGSKFDFDEALSRIDKEALEAERAFGRFREMQVTHGMDASGFAKAKAILNARLGSLRGELDAYLAGSYGIGRADKEKIESWHNSHKPFHWFAEFYGIIANGGFDAIIGNPPYVEYSKVKDAYSVVNLATESTKNLYAFTLERSISLLRTDGRIGLIIPVSFAASGAFEPLRQLVRRNIPRLWLSHFANRPGQLFSGAQNRLTIFIGKKSSTAADACVLTTKYHRWDARNGERDYLFDDIEYLSLLGLRRQFENLFAKVGSPHALSVLNKIDSAHKLAEHLARHDKAHPVYWVRVPGYFCQFLLEPPLARPERGGQPRIRGEVKMISARSSAERHAMHAILNSSTYYLFYCAYTDARHINPSDVYDFPLDVAAIGPEVLAELGALSSSLHIEMQRNTKRWRKSGLLIDSVDSRPCKEVLDRVDILLAKHYGFSDEELDFVLNQDFKFRMGGDDRGAAENERDEGLV